MMTFTNILSVLALSTGLCSVLAAPSQHDQLHRRSLHYSAPKWIKRRATKQKRDDAVAVGGSAVLLAVSNDTLANVTSSSNVTVAANSTNTNTTSHPIVYNTTALWFNETGSAGACLNVSTNDDFVIGLSTLFWNTTGVVSSLCGEKVVITSGNKSVTATVLDASGNQYTTLTIAAFSALGSLSTGMLDVSFSFVNKNLTSLLPKPLNDTNSTSLFLTGPSTSSIAPSPTVAPVLQAAVAVPASAASASADSASADYAASTSYAAAAAASSDASVSYAAQQAAASASAQQDNAQAQDAAAASSSAAAAWAAEASASSVSAAQAYAYYESTQAASAAIWAAQATSTSYQAPAPSPTPTKSSGSGGQTYNGDATYFYQNGVAGACGVVHSESFLGIAIDSAMYAGGSNCWRYIEITNTDSGATVTAQVVDECPTCNSGTSLDLSVGAFTSIATESQGMVPISWKFV